MIRASSTSLCVALALGLAGCASAKTVGDGEVDAAAPDAAAIDGPTIDAPAIDAPAIDARLVDAAVIDAPPIDAPPIDAPPIDAPAIDAPPIDACVPAWTNLLVNGAFDGATVMPWTQTSTIIRTAAMMPFAPQSAPNAALFGASNNANDVLVQTVMVPASATALRVRGVQCHVTEDPIAETDRFKVTLETPAGVELETLTDVYNDDVLPICAWLPFTWNAVTAHAGQPIVLKLRGRTNLALLTRFAVDSLALEVLACP
jgi:hypothetical protein